MRFLYGILSVIIFFVMLAWFCGGAVAADWTITDGEAVIATAIVFAGGVASGK